MNELQCFIEIEEKEYQGNVYKNIVLVIPCGPITLRQVLTKNNTESSLLSAIKQLLNVD